MECPAVDCDVVFFRVLFCVHCEHAVNEVKTRCVNLVQMLRTLNDNQVIRLCISGFQCFRDELGILCPQREHCVRIFIAEVKIIYNLYDVVQVSERLKTEYAVVDYKPIISRNNDTCQDFVITFQYLA